MANLNCPNCYASNASDQAYCSNCGEPLTQSSLFVRRSNGLTIGSRDLPARQLKQIGASVAVGMAALLAEAALIWLRRRVQKMESASLPAAGKRGKGGEETAVFIPNRPAADRTHTVTVVSERVVEIHRWGRPVKRIIERMAWRREET